MCDCCQTNVAHLENGVIAAYRNRSKDEIRDVFVARLESDKWQPEVNVGSDQWEITGCPVNGTAIAADRAHVVVAWFTAEPSNRVRIAFSSDEGRSFSTPINVTTERPIGRVDVVLLESGSAIVSWLEQGDGALLLREVSERGELGAIEKITSMATHRNSGFPKMVRAGNQLVFAWTDARGETSHVRTAIKTL